VLRFLRTFYGITQFQKLQGCVDLNRALLIKTQETGFLRVSALEIYHTTALFYILILYKFKEYAVFPLPSLILLEKQRTATFNLTDVLPSK